MNHAITVTTNFVYKHIGKPILFKIKPDRVHSGLLSLANVVQKSNQLLKLIHFSWSYSNDSTLSQEINKVKFVNPIGLSAGFDKNIETVKLMKAVGFGFMIGGSVTYEECEGNVKPWFYRLPKSRSIVVNVGLANQGIKKVTQRILRYPTGLFDNFPLSISVAKTNSLKVVDTDEAIADYVGSLREIKRHNLSQMVEINISCPNTYGGEPFNTPDRLEGLLTAIDAVRLDVPVYVKMPQDLKWSDFRLLLEVIVRHNIAGVTLTNLAKDRNMLHLQDELSDDVKGNLSGKPTEERSNYLIKKTYIEYGDRLTIIGVGGVFSGDDAYKKIKLGASLVCLITGMIFEGPQLIGSINKDLDILLKKDGYANISEAVGVDART